ncbi:MAG: chromate efflux transporter [Candidatus Eisenbacteria bacterium]|nr:chromate efflux transporter [Candidatus Eisenbacteria bacterium]
MPRPAILLVALVVLVTYACVVLDGPTRGRAAWVFLAVAALGAALLARERRAAPAGPEAPASPPGPAPALSLRALLREGLVLGLTGFGGGLAVLAQIERRLVERRRWIDDETFLESAAVAQSLPGAVGFNVLAFIGWRLAALGGALALAGGFILPSFLILLAFALLYPHVRDVGAVAGFFHLLVPVVVGLITATAIRLGGRVALSPTGEPAGWRGLARDRVSLVVLAAAALAVAVFGLGVVETVLAAGLVGVTRHYGPNGRQLLEALEVRWRWLRLRLWAATRSGGAGRRAWWRRRGDEDELLALSPALALAVPAVAVLLERLQLLGSLSGIFLRAGALTFGGGFVMIPLLEAELVRARHWLTPQAFADAMALGQVTPGPVVITATFVGYSIGGLAGALLATAAVFLPAFVLALLVSSSIERFRSALAVQAFLHGLQPAIVGLLLAAAATLARHGVRDPLAAGVAVAALLLLWRWRLNPTWVVLGAAVLGVAESLLRGRL